MILNISYLPFSWNSLSLSTISFFQNRQLPTSSNCEFVSCCGPRHQKLEFTFILFTLLRSTRAFEDLPANEQRMLVDASRRILYEGPTPTTLGASANSVARHTSYVPQKFKFTSFAGAVNSLNDSLLPSSNSPTSSMAIHKAVEKLWRWRGHLISSPELLTALLVAAPVHWPPQCQRVPQVSEPEPPHYKVLWMLLLSNLYR